MSKPGTSMNSYVTTPSWRKKQARRREAEQARWASLAGPLEVTFVDPEALRAQGLKPR